MEVLELRAAHLSNFEVLTFLSELDVQKLEEPPAFGGIGDSDKSLMDLHTIEQEVIKYLKSTPCVAQSSTQVQQFKEALQRYDITKAEKLMLLNIRPRSIAELNPLIEDIDDRLSQDQQEDLVGLIQQLLPYEEPLLDAADEGEATPADPMDTENATA
ncbi:uncharacterized protein SPPG_00721 [Spizellomyces punctatus DAOM BR117]|uniref:DNA-directed RNA polymerase III subunit RPC9 n=1 Tax=Spizellomyces punctatus (strain DAOM BR117) TaxID=645134 RepID=A0A0L0HVZ3_SPIPD|nr:uncharacterized protein SPPG_00721 [Spizellomyces punctatus DAOM BR117]KND05044.1 hypothetical protein SPPG_00721 [Spizellomyces punctatus DAOM BR117]|eukprot:XP_016613083.1 hypothetical protein SPPG_00721 [Spizellomyces punctatus DAOM BR117]